MRLQLSAIALRYHADVTVPAGGFAFHDCQVLSNHLKENNVKLTPALQKEYRCIDPDVPNRKRDCNLVRVGEPILTIPIGWPVSQRLATAFAWSLVTLEQEGTIRALLKKFKPEEERRDPTVCGVTEPTSSDEDTLRLPLSSMTGAFVASWLIISVGVVLRLLKLLSIAAGWIKSPKGRDEQDSPASCDKWFTLGDIVTALQNLDPGHKMPSSLQNQDTRRYHQLCGTCHGLTLFPQRSLLHRMQAVRTKLSG